MEIWVNPACSKCRSALSILDAAGAAYTVRRYLESSGSGPGHALPPTGGAGSTRWQRIRS